MIIEVTDEYELRCTDGINWQVFKFKERKTRGEDRKYTGESEKQWVALPSYHGSIESGVSWIINDMPKKKTLNQRKTLEQYIKDMKTLERRITKKIKEGVVNE